jgi:hypothetical protein
MLLLFRLCCGPWRVLSGRHATATQNVRCLYGACMAACSRRTRSVANSAAILGTLWRVTSASSGGDGSSEVVIHRDMLVGVMEVTLGLNPLDRPKVLEVTRLPRPHLRQSNCGSATTPVAASSAALAPCPTPLHSGCGGEGGEVNAGGGEVVDVARESSKAAKRSTPTSISGVSSGS